MSICFVVTTWKRDVHYARALIESIRYWHPDTPVKVIVDGHARARDLSKAPNVVSVDRTAELQKLHGLQLGGLLSDLNLFFFDDFEYYVRCDADSVLIGDVIGGVLHLLPFDFLSLDGRRLDLAEAESNRLFSQYAFSPSEMRQHGEEFPDTNILYFSGGHFCTRRQLFDREYLARWRPQMASTFRKDLLFKFNDQSFLNFAINSQARAGFLTAKLWPITLNGRALPADFPDVSLESLVKRVTPSQRIIHYTGPSRRQYFRDHNFGWSLQFFNSLWYERSGVWASVRDRGFRALEFYLTRNPLRRYYNALRNRLIRLLSRAIYS